MVSRSLLDGGRGREREGRGEGGREGGRGRRNRERKYTSTNEMKCAGLSCAPNIHE